MAGALVPPLGCLGLPEGVAKVQPQTYVLETLEQQALNGSPLVTLQCVPIVDVKMLLRRAPRPPTLTYVLLTYVLAIPEPLQNEIAPKSSKLGEDVPRVSSR